MIDLLNEGTLQSQTLRYTREFMLSLNDIHIPLPPGFKCYRGLMKDDYPKHGRAWRQYPKEGRSTYMESRGVNDDLVNQDNDTSWLGDDENPYRSRRYNNKTHANGSYYYKSDYNHGGGFRYQSRNLFKEQPNISDMMMTATSKDPKEWHWYYRDLSYSIQGPFAAEDMQKWYKAGYFAPTMMVRRDDEVNFQPLIVLIEKVGNMEQPFLTHRPSRLFTNQEPMENTCTTSFRFLNVLSNTRYASNLLHMNLYNLLHTHFLKDHRWDKQADETLIAAVDDTLSKTETTGWSDGQGSQETITDDSPKKKEWEDVETLPFDQIKIMFDEAHEKKERLAELSWATLASGEVGSESFGCFLAPSAAPNRSFREIQQEEEEMKTQEAVVPSADQWQAFARSFYI